MKLKSFFTFITAVAILNACQESSNSEWEKTNANSSEILSLVFDTLIGNKSYWKTMKLPISLPIDSDNHSKSSQLQLEKERYKEDSIKQKLDTAQYFVFVQDNLGIPIYRSDYIINILSKEKFKANFQTDDSVKRNLLLALIQTGSKEKLELKSIKSKYQYVLKHSSSRPIKKNEQVILGDVTFSKIIFNEDETIACIYAEIICGQLCGAGNIYFIEKVNDKWVIILKKNLWVS